MQLIFESPGELSRGGILSCVRSSKSSDITKKKYSNTSYCYTKKIRHIDAIEHCSYVDEADVVPENTNSKVDVGIRFVFPYFVSNVENKPLKGQSAQK